MKFFEHIVFDLRDPAFFRIDGVDYDLAKGAFFIICSEGERLEVAQLSRNLPDVEGAPESCVAFLKADEDAAKLINGTSMPDGEPQ